MSEIDFSKLTILIVEDDQYMRKLVTEMLLAFGVSNIQIAKTGRQGLKIIQEAFCDIAITDWVMEPMSGLEFTQKANKLFDRRNKNMPIIMLTAHTELKRVQAARASGVCNYIKKPVSPSELYDRISTTLIRQQKNPFGSVIEL